MNAPPVTLKIGDDSGFLAIVDPAAYDGFVDKNWELEDLVRRFRREMQQRRLLLWGTGSENEWNVRVLEGVKSPHGFRAIVGPLMVTDGRILLTSYEGLTMAAQFADVHLPEPHEAEQELQVESGMYNCAIVQTADPDVYVEIDEVAFTVILNRTDRPVEPWYEIAWREDLRGYGNAS
jgi:hypothetical protein